MGTSNRGRRIGSGDEHRRNGETHMELVGNEKGVIEGYGTVAGWNENVNRLMDASPRFTGAVRAAYSRFCLSMPDSAIPPEDLLSALQYFLQIIVEDLDERAAKILRRHVTQEDIAVISRNDEILEGKQGQPIDFRTFDLYARHVMKRVVLDRGKRLGLFMLGGLVAVHVIKSVVKEIPLIGALVKALVPTILAGPAVGVVGAVYL